MILLLLPAAIWAETLPGRYIVELRQAAPLEGEQLGARAARQKVARPAAEGLRANGFSAAFASRQTALRQGQASFRQRLAERGLAAHDGTEVVANTLFVQATAEQAAALRQLPEVKQVYPVRQFQMRMDRAVALHKVPEAWARVGGEAKAGDGIRIAIIDSGIDASHPALQDDGFTLPEGFPKTASETDQALTSRKVIVARSYVSLLPSRDPDLSARDRVGHGTALATISAGRRTAAPLAEFVGVAPGAYLGNYKVFGTPGFNTTTSDEAILKAIDDAVADGMDILNLSLGDDVAVRLELDPLVAAIERVSQAGVLVVVAAGNNGPNLATVGSPGTAPSALTVGASTNDRTFGTQVFSDALGSIDALNGDGPAPASAVSGPLADLASLDNPLACTALPSGSLSGRIALILRGGCIFETKLLVAQRAGALGAIVYAAEASPSAIYMAVGTATLPAQMVSHTDGLRLKALAASAPEATLQQLFTLRPMARQANAVASFSSLGPSVNLAVKPELLATGQDLYMGTQSFDSRGAMYSADRYTLADGTSFSTPLVAGAAAVLMQARPGLTAAAYKSLLVHSATPLDAGLRPKQIMQHGGAGLLQLHAALQAPLSANQLVLSFGAVAEDASLETREAKLTLTNLSGAADTFLISGEGLLSEEKLAEQPLQFSVNQLNLGVGESGEVAVQLPAKGLPAGTYEGYALLTSASTGQVTRIPYWFAVTRPQPQIVSILSSVTTGRRGATQRNAILFKLLDASGVPNTTVRPTVEILSGGGVVRAVTNYDEDVPGLYGVDLQFGAQTGIQQFRLQAGDATLDISITVN